MTVQEAIELIKTNQEEPTVKSFLEALVSEKSKDIVEVFKASKEYKEELKTEGDRRANGAVESFMKEKMPTHVKRAVEEKIKELNPEETPKDKDLRETKELVQTLLKKDSEKEFQLKASSAIVEKKLPPEMLTFLKKMSFNDDDDFNSTIESFSSILENGAIQRYNEKIASVGGKPAQSKQTHSQSITREQLQEMSKQGKFEEINKLRSEGKLDNIMSAN